MAKARPAFSFPQPTNVTLWIMGDHSTHLSNTCRLTLGLRFSQAEFELLKVGRMLNRTIYLNQKEVEVFTHLLKECQNYLDHHPGNALAMSDQRTLWNLLVEATERRPIQVTEELDQYCFSIVAQTLGSPVYSRDMHFLTIAEILSGVIGKMRTPISN